MLSPSLFLLLCLHAAVVTVVSLLVVVVATVMNWRLSWPMEKVPARRWRRLWRPGPVSIMQLATLKVKLLMNAKWAKGCPQRGKEERREGGGDKGCTTLQLQFYGVYKRNERSVSARSLRPMPIYMQLSWPSGAFEVCVSFHSVPATFLAWPGLAWLQVCTLCAALLRLPDDDIANTSADLKSQFELKAKLNRARSQLRLKAASMHN